MKYTWKVEIRTNCKVCGKVLPTLRHRTFCSDYCRNKNNHIKAKNKPGFNERNRKYNDKKWGTKAPGKIKCLICGLWYRQLGSHVAQRHKITARNYRIMFGIDRKTGKYTCSQDLRELYAKQALENNTYKNLKAGKKHRFVKGDKRAGRYERSEQTLKRLRKVK